MWPGQALSLEVDEVLHEERTEFQDLLVFRSKAYGNVLVLDGAIQATERDEFAYQEMIAHLPLCAHPCPEKVLVIGGGDGGVLREIAKHPCVQEIVICELDKAVPAASQKFLPQLGKGFQDPRVTVHHRDGALFLEEHVESFDVIITDSSDPVGPAAALFEESFYFKIKNALKPGGISCSQGEAFWLHLGTITPMMKFCRDMFDHVEYASCMVPTYPSGQIGFLLCSKDSTHPKVARSWSHPSLRYYNTEVHQAAFVLPEFVRRAVAGEPQVQETEWGY
eukprot:TRINITY_DN23274_c0_g2_i4.p1 TRINITY_DN23274_c0_g2~~TRINITY_DN23274_c0_g2_i4.p1  ORF type:complete len:279 (-),score=57.18 TRINITY_DN23274_c0_g2_i4:185-1021(-)